MLCKVSNSARHVLVNSCIKMTRWLGLLSHVHNPCDNDTQLVHVQFCCCLNPQWGGGGKAVVQWSNRKKNYMFKALQTSLYSVVCVTEVYNCHKTAIHKLLVHKIKSTPSKNGQMKTYQQNLSSHVLN